MATFLIETRNNADARRMGTGELAVPGASAVKHLGRKSVKVTTDFIDATVAFFECSPTVESYELVNSETLESEL